LIIVGVVTINALLVILPTVYVPLLGQFSYLIFIIVIRTGILLRIRPLDAKFIDSYFAYQPVICIVNKGGFREI
jgi:hypothetical protein